MPVDPANRQAELATQINLQLRLERAMRRRIRAALNKALRNGARGFLDGGIVGVQVATASHEEDVRKVLTAFMLRTGTVFGNRILDSLRARQTRDAETIFEEAFRLWVQARAATQAKRISDTTITQIRDIILAAFQEGIGSAATAKQIREATSLTAFRSNVIARTETHTAANQASQEAARSTPQSDELKREWIAAEDDRTRSTHMAANTQVVGMEEPFKVGEASLMFPGDPNGPPGEIINCRCTLAYITPEFG